MLRLFILLLICYSFIYCQDQKLIVCEDGSVSTPGVRAITCPENHFIRITNAYYGRVANVLVCERTDTRDCGDIMGSITSEAAGEQLTNHCINQNSCDLVANNRDAGGDPCSGIFKYLEIDYQCITWPSNPICQDLQAQTKIICEGQTDTVECPCNEIIKVISAFYGAKDDVTTCRRSAGRSCGDESTDTASENLIKTECDNKNSCSLNADNSIFGDPCSGVFKYIKVDYECQKTDEPLKCEANQKKITRKSSEDLGEFSLKCNKEVIQAPGQNKVFFKSDGEDVFIRFRGDNIIIKLRRDKEMSDLVDSGPICIPVGLFIYNYCDFCVVQSNKIEIQLEEELEETDIVVTEAPTTAPPPQAPLGEDNIADTSQQQLEGGISNTVNADSGDNIQTGPVQGSVNSIKRDPFIGSRTIHTGTSLNNQETNSGEQLGSANPIDRGRTLSIQDNEVSDESSAIAIDRNADGVPRASSDGGSSGQSQLLENRGRQQRLSRGQISSNSLLRYIQFEDRARQQRYHESGIHRTLKESTRIPAPKRLDQRPLIGSSASRRGIQRQLIGSPARRNSLTFGRRRRDVDSVSFVHPLLRGISAPERLTQRPFIGFSASRNGFQRQLIGSPARRVLRTFGRRRRDVDSVSFFHPLLRALRETNKQ